MDLTLLTCNYDTPTETLCMLKSLIYTSSNVPNICIVNTSKDDESEKIFEKENIPFINYRSNTHGRGVNKGFENINTKYVLLVDTDILFLKDFMVPFEKFKNSGLTVMGKVVGDCGGKKLHPRVEPWYCFLDLEVLKSKNITFFDEKRSDKANNSDIIYDVGSSMLEDILNNDLLVGDVNLEGKYFKHYGGMSWRCQKYNPNDVDTDIDFGGTHPHKQLWEIGTMIKQKYTEDVKYLQGITLEKIFK